MSNELKTKRLGVVGDEVEAAHFLDHGFGFCAVDDPHTCIELPEGTRLQFKEPVEVYDGPDWDQSFEKIPPGMGTVGEESYWVIFDGMRGKRLLSPGGKAKIISLPS